MNTSMTSAARRGAVAIVSTLFAMTTMASDAENVIARILHQVEQNNLELRALRHEHQAAQLEMKGENTLSGPSVEYSPFYRNGATGTAESELIVKEDIEFPTRYIQRRQQARLQQDVQSHQYQSQRRSILLDAHQLCLSIIRSNRLISLLERRHGGSDRTLELFEKKIKEGDATQLEINKVKLNHTDVVATLQEAQALRARLLAELAQLNGGQTVTLADTVFPARVIEKDYESFRQSLPQQDEDVLAAQATVTAAQHEVSATRQEWLPNLSVGYRRNTDMGEKLHGFLVGAAFPILSTRDRVRAAQQREQSAQVRLQQTSMAAERTLQATYEELVSLERMCSSYDTEMMNETLSLLDRALALGEISALEYYTEVDAIYEKLQSQIELQYKKATLYAELYRHEL